jgi:hypothetical protein
MRKRLPARHRAGGSDPGSSWSAASRRDANAGVSAFKRGGARKASVACLARVLGEALDP